MTDTTHNPNLTTTAGSDYVSIIPVDPDLASRWLALNSKNRNLREGTARAYAEDMAAGDWRWTGETIKFDKTGALLDGQHRLRAVVIADVTVPMLVVRGLEPEAQEDVDRGIPRKFGDVLTLRGETNAAALAALVRQVHLWKAGRRGERIVRGGRAGSSTGAQLSRTLEAHPELREYVTKAKTTHAHLPKAVTPSLIGLAWWVFAQIDEEDAEVFFAQLDSMEGLFAGDPIYELRKALDRMENVKGSRAQSYILALVIKAWNFYRAGEKVGLLRFQPGGSRKEPFPEPR